MKVVSTAVKGLVTIIKRDGRLQELFKIPTAEMKKQCDS